MDVNKLIIIALVVIIVLLGIIAATMVFNNHYSEDTIVKIGGNKSFEQYDNLTVKLIDSNDTGLKDQKLHISISDKKGKEVLEKSVLTNSKGKAKVKLDLPQGKYKVNVTFDGTENYSGSSTHKSIEITKKVVKTELVSSESQSEVSSSDSSSQESSSSSESYSSDDDPYNGMYEEYEDENGDRVQQFNWGDGTVERDYADGYYEIERPDGSVDRGYYPGYG